MKDIKEIVFQAIREIADTEDAERWAVHNDICYDIAVRAVELALGEEQPSTAAIKKHRRQPRTAAVKKHEL